MINLNIFSFVGCRLWSVEGDPWTLSAGVWCLLVSSGPDEIYQTANLYGRGAGQTCQRCLTATVLRMEGTIRNYYGIKGEKGVLNNFVEIAHIKHHA